MSSIQLIHLTDNLLPKIRKHEVLAYVFSVRKLATCSGSERGLPTSLLISQMIKENDK